MPIYTNPPAGGPAAIQLNVRYVPGLMGQKRIRYVGLGATAATHQGYLDYTISAVALEIHTMTAQPQGARLGSLLLYEAANRAAFHGLNRIEALNVAATARGFYLGAGFHPSAAGHAANQEIGAVGFDVRFHLARNVGTWDAQRQQILHRAFQSIKGVWI